MQSFKALKQEIDLVYEVRPFSRENDFKVFSDYGRLQQVLTNLVSNALKFTDKNGVITISCRPMTINDENFLQASVQDTGIGISKEDQEKMFKLFGFLSSSESRNSKGIGLGLYISQQIVSEFGGGKILLDSELGMGTKFTLRFKIDEVA